MIVMSIVIFVTVMTIVMTKVMTIVMFITVTMAVEIMIHICCVMCIVAIFVTLMVKIFSSMMIPRKRMYINVRMSITTWCMERGIKCIHLLFEQGCYAEALVSLSYTH